MISPKISKWFRGFAILMVIASHYAGWMFVEPINPSLREWVMTLGIYGVDIFFLLSGYGLVKSAAKSGIDKRFVWNRFSSSYLPYFIIVGVIMLVDGDFDSFDSIVDFLTGQDYWFMANLFVFYILFMVFWKIGIARKILLTIGVCLYSIFLFQVGKADFWIVSNFSFLIGVLWAEYENVHKEFFEKPRNRSILLVGSYLGMWYCYQQYTATLKMSWESGTSIFFTIFVMTICLMISQAGSCMYDNNKILRILFSGKIMGTLGTHSLFIYLLHTRLFYLIIFELGDIGYRNQATITGLITIVVGVVIGWMFTKGVGIFEKRTGIK